VLPVTSSGRTRPVSNEVVSSGIAGLDAMVRNGGFYRGSSILVSGVAGTGKTTIGAHFVNAACRRGERCMFFLFEEGADEVCRNARSVGLDLQQWVRAGLLRLEASRPALFGLEMHLARMHRDLVRFRPTVVVIDPISAFRGPGPEVHAMLLRLVDLLKSYGITGMFTSLRDTDLSRETNDQAMSSLMDSWIKLVNQEANGEHNRVLHVVKSRGTSHSNQVREFRMTDTGIELIDAYIGAEGVLTGTARLAQEAREQAEAERRQREIELRRRELARRRATLQREIAELQDTLEAEAEEARLLMIENEAQATAARRASAAIAARREAAE
jgi:circadian clock protein KaiC